MSVEMWNCHSWPLDVSRNVKLPFLTTICLLYIYICIVVDLAIKLIWSTCLQWHLCLKDRGGGGPSDFESYWEHLNSEEITLCSASVHQGGSICLWCLYLYICTGISLYFLINWLFQMGSHLRHWKAKSSLCALAVSNGGGFIISFTRVNLKIWSPGRLGVLINKVFSLCEDQEIYISNL